ncbi:MAG: HAMP domain-containing histidine kinase, partial [Bdellovibrionales bacterium]|nr:HAMP domain-containing histidine kinase [Bdellovibrionales bacterium]
KKNIRDFSEEYREFIGKVATTYKPDIVHRLTTGFVQNLDGVCHASLWGCDDNQKRVFFITEYCSIIGISDFPDKFVINYGEDLFGKIAEKHGQKIIKKEEFASQFEEQYISNYLLECNVNTIAFIPLDAMPEHVVYVVIASTKEIYSDIIFSLDVLKHAFSASIQALARIKTRSFEKQLRQIINSKVHSQGLEFLKNACSDMAETFSATSVSIWTVDKRDVIPLFFSEPHESPSYVLGQGLTGTTAESGKPVYLHIVSDSLEYYNINWVGLVSDFSSKPADPRDHIIIVPLIYPRSASKESTVNGVVRFVSKFDSPSFWPVDFIRAKSISEIISVILHQEEMTKEQQLTATTQEKLINLLSRASPSLSPDELYLLFLEEMDDWPHVNDITFIQHNSAGAFDFHGCRFISEAQKNYLLSMETPSERNAIRLDDKVVLWPIFVREDVSAYIIASISSQGDSITRQLFYLAAQMLGYIRSISLLISETEALRTDNEERQLQALAGTVFRVYAHEALNGAKALQSWIKIARRKSVNLDALEERVNEIFENITELLDSTGFAKMNRRDCVFNDEIKRYLDRLGFKNNKVIDGCILKVKIAGHKHSSVNIDPNTLVPIINNLVLNAKEQYRLHAKTGPIEIEIIHKEIDEANYIGFSVKDYAVGILDDDQDRIFRSGETTKKNGQGLGLWIVKKLTEACEGIVEIESIYGYFAKFNIYYPVVDDAKH